MLAKPLLFSLLLLFTGATWADDVIMAFGAKIPPYSFPETDLGIELEVIGEALSYSGHQLKPRYYPLARVPLSYRNGEVDAAMTDLGQIMVAFYGDPAVIYQNRFITLSSRQISIKQPEDLAGLSIVAFQGAAKRYPEWLAASEQAGLYFEQTNQELQVLGLNMQRFDVVLSDISIYRYFERTLENTQPFRARPVDFHKFIDEEPINYRPIFRDEHIRDDFNVGLAHLKATGRLEAIICSGRRATERSSPAPTTDANKQSSEPTNTLKTLKDICQPPAAN